MNSLNSLRRKMRWAALPVFALVLAVLAIVQNTPRPLAGPEDTIAVQRVARVSSVDGDADFTDVALTGETRRAVGAILGGQTCRGYFTDPYPLDVAACTWEVDFSLNGMPGYHAVYGVQNFVYCANPARGQVRYRRIAKGADAAAALAEVFA